MVTLKQIHISINESVLGQKDLDFLFIYNNCVKYNAWE